MRGFAEIAERLRRATVTIAVSGGGGTGMVWSSDGLILTNAHVARDSAVEVALWDGRRFRAELVIRDPRRDLAALRIHGNGLEAIARGNSDTIRPGEVVLAMGNPLGVAGALSRGVVHSVGPLPGFGRGSWIAADLRLLPGNSGGPLVNSEGLAIGVNTAIVNGLGVAVPINAAAEFLSRARGAWRAQAA